MAGMRIVVDSNRINHPSLDSFLSGAPDRFAVLPDHVCMEAFKGGEAGIHESWKVLRKYPAQIVVLQGTLDASVVDPRIPGAAFRMISKSETAGAANFAYLLERAAAGDTHLSRQLQERIGWANSHFERLEGRNGDMAVSIAEFKAAFDKAELKRIQRGEPLKPETMLKLGDLVDTLARISFARHPRRPPWPRSKHRANHFIFRHTLAYVIYMLRFLERGAQRRAPETARNDAADIVIATFATYFNGLMSNDGLATDIHGALMDMLSQGGARIPDQAML